MTVPADGLLVDVYKLARRIGRSGATDGVCQLVVQQASRTIAAERVSIALYRSDEQKLAIAAACGYELGNVEHVRIQPGDWVTGHVYASGRAVVVRDARRLQGASGSARRYRSASFAAIPIVAARRVVGVLSATDKLDGTTFTTNDVAALRAIAGVAALGLAAARTEAEVHRLTHAATVDSLTGLFNRRSFDVRLRQEIERAKRSSSTLAVLMVDIDNFKAINDTQGHPAGDVVLQDVANVLRSVVRVFDFCARYGGDEFAIVMPNSDRASTSAAAGRIRQRISMGGTTVSVGAATLRATDTAEEILQRADDSLYRAKAIGKNCVVVAPAVAVAQLRPAAGRFRERPSRR